MREDVEEIYGKGSFVRYVGRDILSFLGLDKDSLGKKETPNFEPNKNGKKSFAEVLQSGNKLENEEDDIIPLQPTSNPIIAGGNVVVEIDDAEYRRGVEDLKFSVMGKLLLQRGERFLPRWR